MGISPTNRNKIVSRRTVVLGTLMAIPFPIFVSRMYYLQQILGAKYKKLAERNRIAIRPIRPERGVLFDRTGQVLAQDKPAPRLVIIPEQCNNPAQVLASLKKLIPLSRRTIKNTLEKVKYRAPFTPITITKSLSFNNIAKVELNQPDLTGIDFIDIPLRHYENGTSTGHLLGYVGRTDDYKKDKADVKGWAPDFPVGRQGLEKLYEAELGGRPGFLHHETNALGRPIRELEKQDAVKGDDLHLTIDHEIQQYALKQLEGHVGSIVLLNAQTGGIISSVSTPSFDPNDFAEGIDPVNWKKLLNNDDNPLLNRSFQGTYSPGSTFKLVVAQAALEEGLVKPDEIMHCRGKIKLGRREFNCWKKHGKVNLNEAISGSCDIYFYELAKRLGAKKMAIYAANFGYGTRSDIGIPEKAGLLPTPEWKMRVKNERWTTGEDLIVGIGQGFLLTTPLQMAVMTARIATGMEIKPTLLQKYEDKQTQASALSEEYLQILRQGMHDVVHSRKGTAKNAKRKGTKIVGKTGTVQVVSRRIEKGVQMKDVPLKERPHAMFVGYAPYENPQFAVAVVIENGGSGSGTAAPVAANVLQKATEIFA
ncbi:MAG: penicillin-binding protein 2 [Alphaproteobacteria bacterium]|jgi:penicillin-binding protein 2